MTVYLSVSGGLDSTTLLAHLIDQYDDVIGVSFEYGQRHVKEVEAAGAVCDYYHVRHRVVQLPKLSSPALTDGGPVPHGHYAWDTMKQTVVQGRNLLFVSTLVGMTQPGDQIALGVHAGDHAIYPDCRLDFFGPLAGVILDAYDVTVLTPFIEWTKGAIAARAARLKAPVELTWSCYEGGDFHCGRCGTCVERIEAFREAGLIDPTVYVDPDFADTVL